MKLNELGKGETAMIDAFHLPFEIERRLPCPWDDAGDNGRCCGP